MNKVDLIGRVTGDILLSKTVSGKSYANFTLAVRGYKKDEADFIWCTAWEKTAEALSRFVRKGNRLAVSGRIKVDMIEKDGARNYRTYVLVNDVEFLESKTTSQEASDNAKTDNSSVRTNEIDISGITSEDLPF